MYFIVLITGFPLNIFQMFTMGRACQVAPDRNPHAVLLYGCVRHSDWGAWLMAVYRVGVFLFSSATTFAFRCLRSGHLNSSDQRPQQHCLPSSVVVVYSCFSPHPGGTAISYASVISHNYYLFSAIIFTITPIHPHLPPPLPASLPGAYGTGI